MIRFFHFSPSRLALAYIALSVFVLALFAIPLWHAWHVNLSTFREYVQGGDMQRLVEVFDREGAKGLATAIESQVRSLAGDEIMVFADASKLRLAGNLPAWPAEVPDAPGTYGLVIGLGGGSTMRVVASHVRLPGGYHLLMGRESVRFESLVERFWYGISGAMVIVVVLGAVIGWLSHRALLSEVHEISRTASAIVEGDLSRRVATRGGSDELDTLARTVNGMLDQLARQNVQLEGEIAVRRQAEQAFHRAHDDLERLVAQRTAQLARANESLRRNEASLLDAQRLSRTGSWTHDFSSGLMTTSPEALRMWGIQPEDESSVTDFFFRRMHPEDRLMVEQAYEAAQLKKTDFESDFRIVLPEGTIKNIHTIGHPILNESGDIVEFVGAAIDVTERKRAEEERQAHLLFLESMDQVNRAIQGTNDLEQMMSDMLDAVLSIFNCDRAWLVYPCDPEAPSWKVPMEHARPEFPGAFVLGVDLPVSPEIAKVFQTVRASSGPVRFGPGSEHSLPAETAKRFSIQSMIGMVIYPKGDKPYMLGLHQCSYPRAWAPQEERLFQEIGRRLEDALTSLLIFRNLGESERKLEEAQRLTHVGYWERDLDTDLITRSDESYRIFAVPTAEILSFRRVAELIHPDDLAMVLEAVSAALRGGPRYDLEFRVIRPNGEVRIVHSQADVTWDESGRARRMFGTVQDITERKRAEEELRASETRFRTYVDHATDALFVHDDTRKVVDVNREACESLGYTREELIGMTPRDFDPGRGVDDVFIQWMKERLDAGEVFAFETSHRRKDGTLFPVEVRVRPFWHGGHRFGLALVRDITERKRAEETLRQTEAELAHVARVATLGEMTASIAHEINQPLGAVVNNASACLRWLAGPTPNLEEARKSAALITADGHRAGEIISRIRALVNKAPPQKDWVHINETILEVIALARSEVQGNRVALQTQLSDELPLVLGDRIQLQQVILNLVMNGIEAMSAVTDRSRDLLIRSRQYESDKVFVAVQDSGTGLETESLDHLFTAFFTTKPKGMGMGLAISRSIIEAQGGRLWASPNDGPGATFQFTLQACSKGE